MYFFLTVTLRSARTVPGIYDPGLHWAAHKFDPAVEEGIFSHSIQASWTGFCMNTLGPGVIYGVLGCFSKDALHIF